MTQGTNEAKAPTIAKYTRYLESHYQAGKLSLDDLFAIMSEYIRYGAITIAVPNEFGIFYEGINVSLFRMLLEEMPKDIDPMSVEARLMARNVMRDICEGSNAYSGEKDGVRAT